MPETSLTLAYCVDLLRREVIESPICFVDGDSKWLAMTPVMFFSQLCNWDTLFIPINRFPQSVTMSTMQKDAMVTESVRWDAHDVGMGIADRRTRLSAAFATGYEDCRWLGKQNCTWQNKTCTSDVNKVIVLVGDIRLGQVDAAGDRSDTKQSPTNAKARDVIRSPCVIGWSLPHSTLTPHQHLDTSVFYFVWLQNTRFVIHRLSGEQNIHLDLL